MLKLVSWNSNLSLYIANNHTWCLLGWEMVTENKFRQGLLMYYVREQGRENQWLILNENLSTFSRFTSFVFRKTKTNNKVTLQWPKNVFRLEGAFSNNISSGFIPDFYWHVFEESAPISKLGGYKLQKGSHSCCLSFVSFWNSEMLWSSSLIC